jgi:hypothetical protein
MSISACNVPQLSWGTLHIGIKASGSTLDLYGPRTNVNLVKFIVTYFSVTNLGKMMKLE